MQVIPHVTNAIIENILKLIKKEDFLIVEVGGTVGDIESLPFLEAIRQLRNYLSVKRTLFIHCTLLPYLSATDEVKTQTYSTFCERLKRNWYSTRYFNL